jgi:hypothetical protein
MTMYACEEDFDLRKQFPDGASSLNSAELRKTDVQKDQVWLQFLGFLDSLQSVRGLKDDLQFWFSLESGENEAIPRLVIVRYENSDPR